MILMITKNFGDGSKLGLNITYEVQENLEAYGVSIPQ